MKVNWLLSEATFEANNGLGYPFSDTHQTKNGGQKRTCWRVMQWIRCVYRYFPILKIRITKFIFVKYNYITKFQG